MTLHSWCVKRDLVKQFWISRLSSSFPGIVRKRNLAPFSLEEKKKKSSYIHILAPCLPIPNGIWLFIRFCQVQSSAGKNICESTLREKCKCSCCHWAGSKMRDNVQDRQEKIIRGIVMGLLTHWVLIPKWSGRPQECSKAQSEGRTVTTKAYCKLVAFVGMVERFKSTWTGLDAGWHTPTQSSTWETRICCGMFSAPPPPMKELKSWRRLEIS